MTQQKDFPDTMACNSNDCDGIGNFRYTWPGRDEAWVCVLCSARLQGIAAAISLHVQFIPLTADDYMNRS